MNKKDNNLCSKCGLYKKAINAKIPVCGSGRCGVMIVGQSPGKEEDRKGENFVGSSGLLLRKYFKELGLDFYNDFWTINSFRCIPPKGKTGYLQYQKCCYDKFDWDVKQYKPWLIVAMGKEAIQSVFGIFHPISVGQFQDCLIPHVKYNCWVYCTYHPAFVVRDEADNGPMFLDALTTVKDLIDTGKAGLESKFRRLTDWQLDNVEVLTDFDRAVEYIRGLRKVDTFAVDWENWPLKPFAKDSKILCVGFATDGNYGKCIPLDKTPLPKRKPYWSPRQRSILFNEIRITLDTEGPLKIAHNVQHEMLWAFFMGSTFAPPWTCTMVRQHLRWEKKGAGKNGWYGPKSLKGQMFVRRGLWPYDEHIDPPNKNYDLVSDDELFPYCACDAKFTYWLYEEQEVESYDGIGIAEDLHITRGCRCMAEMTWTGVDVDVKVARNLEVIWQNEISELEKSLHESDLGKKWQELKGRSIDLNSGQQVGELLFDIAKMKGGKKTAKSGQWQTTEAVIEVLARQHKWPKMWLRYKKLQKNMGTFVQGYIFDCLKDDGKLHPNFNLALPESFRSSSDDPNQQNFPTRGEVGKEVRKAIVAPEGWRLRAYDFSQHEVRVAAMLSEDRLLIQHVLDGYDFHLEYAAKLLQKVESKTTKTERSIVGKNGFVFPKIYGSGWKNIFDTLSSKGYKVTEKNVKKVYYEFEDVYSGLSEWQQQLIEDCRSNGYVQTPLGYRRHEPLKYSMITNFPVQNVAFALLLYTLSEAMKKIEEAGMRTKALWEVHDDVCFKYPVGEEKQLDRIMVESSSNFPWEFTKLLPLELEAKDGKNWLDMKEVALL